MNKTIKWILIVAAGVFIGLIGTRLIVAYMTHVAINQAVEDLNRNVQKTTEEMRKRTQATQAEQQRQRALKEQQVFEAALLCAVNEDTGKCSCYDQRKKAPARVSPEQCLVFAKR